MAKKDGDSTKKMILEVAEKLFSEKGYDGASVGDIAKGVGINKASIYYHFKSKEEILTSLFARIIQDMTTLLGISDQDPCCIEENLEKIISFLRTKRAILAILLMESIKDNAEHNYLYACSKQMIDNEAENSESFTGFSDSRDKELYYMHEFFTGFMPIISFVVFENTWGKFYEIDKSHLFKDFLKVFKISHIDSHLLNSDEDEK